MNFVVVGAGAWGTAFALHLARNGNPVTLVPRRLEQAGELGGVAAAVHPTVAQGDGAA